MIHAAGLNGQPSFDFDRDDWYEQIGPDSVMMFTSKTRSVGKTIEFQSAMGPDSPFGILTSSLKITKPLHDYVLGELDWLNGLPRSRISRRVHEQIEELESLKGRVWLCLRLLPLGISALKSDYSPLWNMTNMLLQKRGVLEKGRPFEWSGKRARDSFAYDVWRATNGSLAAVRSGLHHDKSTQTENYMDHPLGREEEGVALAQILQQVRADLAEAARTGHRPGANSVDSSVIAAPVMPPASMMLFGPARSWLEGEAPGEVLELLSDSLFPEHE